MNAASPLKNPFRATLDATLSGLRALVDTLREEQAALTGNDPQRLEDCVKRKVAQLQQLEHSVVAREQIQKQAGLEGGLAGAEQFIRGHFTPDEILADWQALKQLSREADELNIQNGKLALAGERSTRQALSILTGRVAQKDTYGKRPDRSNGGGFSFGKC